MKAYLWGHHHVLLLLVAILLANAGTPAGAAAVTSSLRKGARSSQGQRSVGTGSSRFVNSKQPLLASEVQQEMARGVGFENLPVLAIQPQPVTPEQEQVEFRDFDLDGNGYITQQELAQFFYELRPTQKQDKEIFDKLDLDGNGVVSWQEFTQTADAELFDFLERSHNEVTVREIEFVEDIYDKQYGNPMAAVRNLPDAQYNMRGEEISKAEADEKYLPGYGWFKGESPVIDEMYKGEIQNSPNADTELEENPGQHYQYSYGF